MEHLQGILLREYTSFQVGGKAKDLYIPHSAEELGELLKRFHEEERSFYVLGKGSNLLISDEGLEEPVILIPESLLRLPVRRLFSQLLPELLFSNWQSLRRKRAIRGWRRFPEFRER